MPEQGTPFPNTYGQVLDMHPDMPPALAQATAQKAAEMGEPGFEVMAIQEAEHSPHNWDQIAADAPLSPQHAEGHENLGRTIDPGYDTRSMAEQRAVGVVAELGAAAEKETQVGSVSNELARVPERTQSRIEAARAQTEFERSPELDRAIESYFVDHARLATVIEAVADQSLQPSDVQTLLEGAFDGPSYVMNTAVHDLVAAYSGASSRMETLEKAQSMVNYMLFNEASVGAMTLTEDDIQVVPQLAAKIHEAAVTERLFDSGYSKQLADGLPADWEQSRLRLGERAWDDTRPAGQLLFHNTPFMKDIALGGNVLRSRSDRLRNDGSYQANTLLGHDGFAMHTNQTHWSEEFMPRAYKTPKQAQPGSEYPATIAVPLAELIKTAPYGRDCEYGVVRLKAGAQHEVPYNDAVNTRDDYAGQPDTMGRDGRDRVFFADATDPLRGHEYQFDFGRAEGSLVIQLQGDYNQPHIENDKVVRMPGDVPVYGMGQNLPGQVRLDYDVPLRERSVNEGMKINHIFRPEAMNQLGKPFAYDVGNPADAEGSFRGGVSRAEQQKELSDQIAEMQRESRDSAAFKNKVVVPLRQGVIAYRNESGSEDRTFSGVRVDRQNHNVNIQTAA